MNIYCSTRCVTDHKGKEYLERWLLTGKIEGQAVRSVVVRAYILDEQGGRCAICRGPAEWLGQPLVFILDHISGDSTDSSRKNLRLVCPNCDSQLPTYKSKNRGNGRHFRRDRYQRGLSH